jgi:hypothetical protein
MEKSKRPSLALNIAAVVLNNAIPQIGNVKLRRAEWCSTGLVQGQSSRPQSCTLEVGQIPTEKNGKDGLEDSFAGMRVTMKGTQLDIKSPIITQAETEWRTETQKLISEKARMISSGAGAEEMAAWEGRMVARKKELADMLGNVHGRS